MCAEASTKNYHEPLQPMICNYPVEMISIYILELPRVNNYRYILACQDYYTKWLIVIRFVAKLKK